MKKAWPYAALLAVGAAVAGVVVYKKFCEKDEECKIMKLVSDMKAKKKKEDVAVEDETVIEVTEDAEKEEHPSDCECEDCKKDDVKTIDIE